MIGTSQAPFQPCNWRIEQLPGLSQEHQSQLQNCGITTTQKLLKKAHTSAQKQTLATHLHIHIHYVNKWVALAEFALLPSIGCEYCGLLLHAGISSLTQLAQSPPHRLHQQILRLQISTMQRRDLCPSVDKVQEWIQQARQLAVRN